MIGLLQKSYSGGKGEETSLPSGGSISSQSFSFLLAPVSAASVACTPFSTLDVLSRDGLGCLSSRELVPEEVGWMRRQRFAPRLVISRCRVAFMSYVSALFRPFFLSLSTSCLFRSLASARADVVECSTVQLSRSSSSFGENPRCRRKTRARLRPGRPIDTHQLVIKVGRYTTISRYPFSSFRK